MNMTEEIISKTQSNPNGVVGISVDDLLDLDIPPRSCLMEPWLPRSGLAQVYAYRGVGKTFFALNVAYAVATGGEFLGWQCPIPKRVLYIDGEMPAADMQERLKSIRDDSHLEKDNFILITPDFQDVITPNLANQESQQDLVSYTNEADLIIVDNISTLCRTGKENDSDQWTPVQRWALNMRSEGRSVLFVHHANKSGGQRGTSGREDVLDSVIALRKPKGSDATEGANFEVHFEKNRGFSGSSAQAFNASLEVKEDKQIWTRQNLVDSTLNRCITLYNEGYSQTEIASKLDIDKSNVSRHIKKAKAEGLVKED